MRIVVHVPDDMIERVKDKLPPPEVGMLEAVAFDEILGFLSRLEGVNDPARIESVNSQ